MEDRTWIVTATGQRPFDDVVRDLRASGFDVQQELTEVGVAIGFVPDTALDAVRRIPGVGDVSPDQPVDIGPPDEDVS